MDTSGFITQDNRNIFQKGADWLYNNYGPNLPAFEPTNNPQPTQNGASGSWDAPQTPVATPNIQNSPTPVRQTNPVPTPTPQQKQSGGFNINDFPGYAGWDPSSAYQDWLKTGGAGKGGNTGGGLSAEYDNLFSNTFSAYNDIQDMYRNQALTANEGLTTEAATAKSAYQEAFERAKQTLGTQQTELDQSQQGYTNEAIRQYSRAQQNIQAARGMSSSAGVGMSEVVAQEFMRTQGDIRQKYLAGQNVLFTAERQNDRDWTMAVQDLENKVIAGRREINNNLNSQLLEINTRKAILEDDKRNLRIQAMQESNLRTEQLKADREAKLWDLGMWKVQRNEEMGIAQKELDRLASEVKANLTLNTQGMSNTIPAFQSNTFFSPTQGTQALRPNNPNDPYKELV